MVNNRAEAQALASYSLYPPKGKRSNGPIRAAMYGEASNYQKIANDEVLVIPMIETQEGIDNIDEILSVPGISGIYIGPADMGLSLGLIPILDREEPLILGIYEKLLASCKKHGKFAGLHNGTSAYAARMIADGLPLRHHRQRQRPDGAHGPSGSGGDTQGGGRRCKLKQGRSGALPPEPPAKAEPLQSIRSGEGFQEPAPAKAGGCALGGVQGQSPWPCSASGDRHGATIRDSPPP